MSTNFKVKNIFFTKTITGERGYKPKNSFSFHNAKLAGLYFNIHIKNFIFSELNNEKQTEL